MREAKAATLAENRKTVREHEGDMDLRRRREMYYENRFRPEICDPQGPGGVPGATGPVRGAAASGAGDDVEIKTDTEAACNLTEKRESTIISLTDN